MKLFRPLWYSRNEKRAVKAVEKIKDEAKLVRVISEARCWLARKVAAGKLTDQELILQALEEIKCYNCMDIQFILVKKLENTSIAQKLLSEIVAIFSSYNVSQSTLDFKNAVLDCITEQSALFYVADRSRIHQIYLKAIEQLTDANLYEFARGRGYDKGHMAIQKLNDQKLLEDLAINDKEMAVRFWAAQKLINKSLAQSIYADVVKNATDHNKRLKMEAAKLLDDQSSSQQLYESFAINSNSEDFALEAVSLLNEQKLIGNVVKNAYNNTVREEAAKKLTNQDVLKEIKLKTLSVNIRKILVEKLTNQSILAEIAESDDNIEVKTAAIKNFDENNLQFIPEIVEKLLSIHNNYYSNKEVNDFIQFAYKVSKQEQKQILNKHEGRILPRIDSYTDICEEYADWCGDGGYVGSSINSYTDSPEITICF